MEMLCEGVRFLVMLLQIQMFRNVAPCRWVSFEGLLCLCFQPLAFELKTVTSFET
jgi:hypothetical protein